MNRIHALILVWLIFQAKATNFENDSSCIFFGRFITQNTSFDFESLLQNRVMILSNFQHDDDLPQLTYLFLWINHEYYYYRHSILAFHSFIEETFRNVPCIILMDGSSSLTEHTLTKVHTLFKIYNIYVLIIHRAGT